MTIYLWSGKRVAYLKKSNTGYDVYGFNGDHLGWSLPLAPSMIATR
ncbi:4-fold beta flower protein [Bosea sp. 2YAB26]